MTQATIQPSDFGTLNTHRVTCNGQVRYCNVDTFQSVCDALVKEFGGIPRVEAISDLANKATIRIADLAKNATIAIDVETAPRIGPSLVPIVNLDAIRIGDMDTVGRDRSAADEAAAIAAGFSPAQPVFARGSRATGMREHRNEYEALPKTRIAMAQLEDKVVSEERADTTRQVQGIRMNNKGFLLVDVNRDDVPPTHFSVSRRALPALASRIGMPAGAGSYLRDIRPEVRAINFNRWCAEDVPAQHEASVAATPSADRPDCVPPAVVLRTRKSGTGREVFGVVSEGYGAIDADKIARSIRKVSGDDTRCHVKYDGFRTQVDVLWFSNITPEHAVAGEYFKAGVRVRTDDTGGGSVRVSAMIWQNLCLNFVIIDEAAQETARITHVGDPDKLAARFEAAFKQAEDRLVHFRKAWGYAVEDVLVQDGLRIEDVVQGYYNAIIERDLVPLPKRGRDQVVGDLLSMWSKDDSGARFNADGSPRLVTRAAIVNGLTRYSHEVNTDVFAQHDIEAAAGRLLFGKKGAPPAALPFLPME